MPCEPRSTRTHGQRREGLWHDHAQRARSIDLGMACRRSPRHSTRRRPRVVAGTDSTHPTAPCLGAAAVAVLVVGFVGYQLLPGIGGSGGTPTALPTPQASRSIGPSTEPSTTATRQTIVPFACPSAEVDPE